MPSSYQILGNNDLQGDPQVNGYQAPRSSGQSGATDFPAGVTFGSPDTTLYRLAASTLRTDGTFHAGTGVRASDGTAGQVDVGGSGTPLITFGPAGDTNLYRGGASVLATDGTITVGNHIYAQFGAASQTEIGSIGPSGQSGVLFGSGGSTSNLYLNSNGVLRSDGGLILSGGTFLANGGAATVLSFFGSGGAGKQTVTGSKGANAALASLLTALAAHGLVTDTTT